MDLGIESCAVGGSPSTKRPCLAFVVSKKGTPDAPCMDYLLFLGEKWPHSRGNVGKYSLHGAYVYDLWNDSSSNIRSSAGRHVPNDHDPTDRPF